MVYCNTPPEKCSGKIIKVNHAQVNKILKAHSRPQEAFICYSSYLQNQGYRKVGTREFLPAGGEGPILVISRPGKYGLRLRKGKEGRWEPKELHAPIV